MKRSKIQMPNVADKLAQWGNYIIFLENLAVSIRENNQDRNILRKKFAEWFIIYDQRRKTSLTDVFPEYSAFFEMCDNIPVLNKEQ
jgi:hypothetical protein